MLPGMVGATSTTCTTSTVCAEYIDSSSGVAIHGEANTGIGIRGTSNGSTGFYGASRSGGTFFPGVEGESLNQTGNDVGGGFGLLGANNGVAPAYGVLAFGSFYGVYGNTSTPTPQNFSPGYGTIGPAAVLGLETGGSRTMGDPNVGVLGKSNYGSGIVGLSNVTYDETGNLGDAPIGVFGAAEGSYTGNAAIGVLAVSKYYALLAINPVATGSIVIGSTDYSISSNTFNADYSGNVRAATLTTNKETYVRTTGSSGTTRLSYSARTTAPVMEDFGEGQLINGRGYVRLDSALSDVIDNRNAYRVFLTPEGDSNGLYVTGKSPAGFTVRESHGGRSTLSFDYRILAKPVDDDARRLALATPLPRVPSPIEHHRSGHAPPSQDLFDPLARLKASVGPAEFARELKAARKIETAP